jgi:hypothetical protein
MGDVTPGSPAPSVFPPIVDPALLFIPAPKASTTLVSHDHATAQMVAEPPQPPQGRGKFGKPVDGAAGSVKNRVGITLLRERSDAIEMGLRGMLA